MHDISEHLLVIDQSRRRDMLVKIELPHDSIWIVILNHLEVNHPHMTLPPAVFSDDVHSNGECYADA
jgi:hypothetical protein